MHPFLLRLAAGLAAGVAVCGVASPVQAGVIVKIDIYVNSHLKEALTSAPGAGSLSFVGTVSGYRVDVTAFANPLVGGPSEAELDQLSGTITTTNGSGSVEIAVTTINNILSPAGTARLLAAIGGTDSRKDGTLTMTGGVDVKNHAFSSASQSFSIGPMKPGKGGTFSGSAVKSVKVPATSFSLTNTVLVTFGRTTPAHEIVSWDADTLVETPEPGSVALWAFGLIGSGGLGYLRRRCGC